MLRNAKKSPGVKKTIAAAKSNSRWIAGMATGHLLGFAVAVLAGVPMPTMIAATLIGGIIGGISLAGGRKHKKAAPLRDKRIRAYVFEALAETSKKLDEIIIEEEFNGAAGGAGESDRRAMKQEAKPKLAIPMPAPPKMGGMM